LKIRSWGHPTSGGESYNYNLHLYRDQIDPEAEFIYPTKPGRIPSENIQLEVTAQDAGSGVSHVEFLWHNNDWVNADWILLGTDWDGDDGWSFDFDGSSVPDPTGIAFYARAFDWAGNWIGIGVWDITRPNIYFPIIQKP
jgi:hypothetical protein